MPAILLVLGVFGVLTSGPFDDLGKLPALKRFREEVGTFPLASHGGTILARKSYSDGIRRLTVDAVSFPRGTDLSKVVHDRDWGRQGAAVPISLPEFERKGFRIHYVAQPRYLETDVLSGRIWVQIGLLREKSLKTTVLDTKKQISADLRSDVETCNLLKVLLPQIQKLAKRAH